MSEVLSFKYPAILPSGGGLKANAESWQTWLPTNGSIFRSDQSQSVVFNLAHASAFLRTAQSFFTGSILPYLDENVPLGDTSGEPGGGVKISSQGISRIFNRAVIRFGAVVIEDLSYSDLVALYYSTATLSKKALLSAFEGYGRPDFFSKGGSKKFATLLMSSLFVTDQCLPLPLIQGGISVELFIAPASELFLDARVKFYELRSPQLKGMLLYPEPGYTINLRGAVASGRSAYIPFQRVHSFPSNANGSSTQQVVIPCGQLTSIVSVDTVMWDERVYADVTKDKSRRFNDFGLVDWKLEAAGQSNPNQLTFRYDQGSDPETTLIGLISASGNAYLMDKDVSLDPNFLTETFRLTMNFQSAIPNETFGSGLSTVGSASSFITLTTTHNAAVPTTTRIASFVTTDALVEFRGSEIVLTEIF
jgi:hypothetical protein